jgi:hypothetical protein
MSNTMFMGTRERMLEVPCPNVTMPSSKQGWANTVNFMNGGTAVRRSTAASKKYEMTWNSLTRDEARTVLDLADRLYGTGEIYWLDPFAADKNVLPQQWASPMQAIYDGLPLISNPTSGINRPTATVTPDANGFPVQSAQYTCTNDANTKTRTVWVPIPAGYTAHIGVYGSNGTGGIVVATPTIGATSYGTPHTMTLMDVSNTARTNYTVTNDGNYNGVELKLAGSGTIILSGMIVQVLKTGATVTPGGFISGQGNSGCMFEAQPVYTPYSAAFDNVGMTATLVETGAWEQ